MGALAVTGNDFYRDESYGARNNADSVPFDGYLGPHVNTVDYLRRFLEDGSSGIDLPAAIIVETVQGEGGINVASTQWLRDLEQLCRDFDILLIVDDIQMGNGRTGSFFSFEESGIKPDMVTVSKSVGGGLPMAILLMRPELDQWQPGEHTGTFRGNNLAFVAATQALSYWDTDDFAEAINYKGSIMEEELAKIVGKYNEQVDVELRGRGMVWGLDFERPGFAGEVSKKAFTNNLVIELAGTDDNVVKFLPSLVIEEDTLRQGMAIIDKAIGELLVQKEAAKKGDTAA
jgi:diaminobutyrate-2-oxoglutarate transaminase